MIARETGSIDDQREVFFDGGIDGEKKNLNSATIIGDDRVVVEVG